LDKKLSQRIPFYYEQHFKAVPVVFLQIHVNSQTNYTEKKPGEIKTTATILKFLALREQNKFLLYIIREPQM